MPETRIHEQIKELQERWDRLSELLNRLGNAKALETHEKEKYRLEQEIAECEAERRQVEEELVRLGAAGVPSRAAQLASIVSLGSLPESGPDLFGRERELARLDAAWEQSQTNLVIFVAWGGVGKTSLVNRWLLHLRDDNYRGAQRVFGWSFYSQGAAEGKQASADRFFADALRWFNVPHPDEGDPVDKARRLAAAIRRQRTLLILDGVEPLQYPPGPEEGRLKDQGLKCLLKELAIQNPGLGIVTTRLPLTDLRQFLGHGADNTDLTNLTPEDGARLLRHLGARGAEPELQQAAVEFDGHALALNLLGTYLTTVYDGDVRQREKITRLIYPEERTGQHARWVMESYAHWLATTEKGQRELNILRMMGLFDRPADLGAIEALLAEPVIPGLTEGLVALQKAGLAHSLPWKLAIKNLQELRLLAGKPTPNPSQEGKNAPGLRAPHSPPGRGQGWVLDCHPLVREHFGAKLRQEQPDAWQAAHRRLYEYYKRLPEQELPDTLEEMEPLFAAVAHGCAAGMHQEAYDDIFWERITRKDEYYILRKLGAFGAFLAGLANFFEQLWTQPAAGLSDADKALALALAGVGLRAVGRLREAAQPMQAAVENVVKQENWKQAARAASNLSELMLTAGDVPQAVASGRQSVEFADRSGDLFQRNTRRARLADARHQAGELAEAERLFREAEKLQQEYQPEYPYLYSLSGFQFCDLLLSLGQYREVQERAAQTIEWAKQGNLSLLTLALDRLSLGRAVLDEYVGRDSDLASQDGRDRSLALLQRAGEHLDQAVQGLREAGSQHHLPRGLLARAAYFRLRQDAARAWDDLEEVLEIAERGGMRLHLVDYHLEAARLALTAPDAARAPLAAAEHVARAEALIAETGYHRRDREAQEIAASL